MRKLFALLLLACVGLAQAQVWPNPGPGRAAVGGGGGDGTISIRTNWTTVSATTGDWTHAITTPTNGDLIVTIFCSLDGSSIVGASVDDDGTGTYTGIVSLNSGTANINGHWARCRSFYKVSDGTETTLTYTTTAGHNTFSGVLILAKTTGTWTIDGTAISAAGTSTAAGSWGPSGTLTLSGDKSIAIIATLGGNAASLHPLDTVASPFATERADQSEPADDKRTMTFSHHIYSGTQASLDYSAVFTDSLAVGYVTMAFGVRAQ